MPVGEDDYFTTKVFDSAVPAVDYENEVTPTKPWSNPLAAPASIHVAMVERYIPPASQKELADIFTLQGRSLLVDRMVELSPNNGCLVFIYPTKAGGECFLKHYLGPVLDPLLRFMVVTNSLSFDFSSSLGAMNSVGALHNFETMRRRIYTLCERLDGKTPTSAERLHGIKSLFSLVYSSKEYVSLDRKIWSDWWIRQEKFRVKESVSSYFRTSMQLPVAEPGRPEIHQGAFVQQILDGVAQKEARSPSEKIEVGVFVIERRKDSTY